MNAAAGVTRINSASLLGGALDYDSLRCVLALDVPSHWGLPWQTDSARETSEVT